MKKHFLKKALSVTLALTMAAGASCFLTMSAQAQEPGVSIAYAQKLSNKAALSASTITKGESVTVRAAADGGSGAGYAYRIAYKKQSSSSWTTLQDYSTNATLTIKPASVADYEVMVRAKDSNGTVAVKKMVLHVLAPVKNTSSLSSTTIALGESSAVTAAASGGSGGFTYSVIYKKTTDSKWTTKQYYKTNTTVTLAPTEAADYSVCVKAKDSRGTMVKKTFTLHVVADQTATEIQEVFRLTNEERKKEGKSALKQDPKLMQAAAKRAQEITEEFAHTRPDGTSCFTVLDEYSVSWWAAAENIAYGQSSAAAVMNSWMNSSGHKENILKENMTHIGIGLYIKNGRKYWVQLFAQE